MVASMSRSRKSFDGPTAEEKIVASLIELREAGSAPWRRPWDGSGGGHHVNLLSGHRYRGANPILLTLGMHMRALPSDLPAAGQDRPTAGVSRGGVNQSTASRNRCRASYLGHAPWWAAEASSLVAATATALINL